MKRHDEDLWFINSMKQDFIVTKQERIKSERLLSNHEKLFLVFQYSAKNQVNASLKDLFEIKSLFCLVHKMNTKDLVQFDWKMADSPDESVFITIDNNSSVVPDAAGGLAGIFDCGKCQ